MAGGTTRWFTFSSAFLLVALSIQSASSRPFLKQMYDKTQCLLLAGQNNWVILEQACSWPVRKQSFAKTPSFYHNKFSYLWCDKVTLIARFSIPTILKFMFTTMMTKFLLVVIWWSDIVGTSSLLGWWRNVPARQGGMTYLKVRPWWLMRRIYGKCSSLVGSLWLPQVTN